MIFHLPFKEAVYFLILNAGVILGTFRLRSLSWSGKMLLYLLCFTLFSEVCSEACRAILKNNMMVFHVYNPLHYALLAVGYNYELKKNRFIHLTIAVYLTFGILNAIFWQPFFEVFCSYSFNINAVLVSSLCLYYLYRLLQEETENQFTEYPLFWISVGYLIYNCINLLGLGAFNELSENSDLSYVLEVVRGMSNYLLYTLFIIAFLAKQKSLTP